MADDKKQKTLFLDDSAGAPPPAAPPISSQSTMMLDAPSSSAAPRQMVVPTMMKEPPRQQLPPMQRPGKPSTVGRWIAGPIIAVVVAAGTVAVAGMVMPRGKKPVVQKPQGKLRVNTNPPGASILVDGKRFPRFTPAEIEGDIGATLKLTFSMDGFQTQESEVYVGEGEHTFSVALKPVAAPSAPEPSSAEPAPKHEHHSSASATAKAKDPVGEATISVLVRPWAIVFVDKQRLKQTPVQGYKMPSGKHVIELVNESKGRREKIEVNLKPGEDQQITRDWDK